MSENSEKYIEGDELRPVVVLKRANKILHELQDMVKLPVNCEEVTNEIYQIILDIEHGIHNVVGNVIKLSNSDANNVVEKGLYSVLMELRGKLLTVAFKSGEESSQQQQLLDMKDQLVSWYGDLLQLKFNKQPKYNIEQIFDIINTLLLADLNVDTLDSLETAIYGEEENAFGMKLSTEDWIVASKLIMQTRIRRIESYLDDMVTDEMLHESMVQSSTDNIADLMRLIDSDILSLHQRNQIDDDYLKNMQEKLYTMMRKLIFNICVFDSDDDAGAETVTNNWSDIIEEEKASPDLNAYIAVANFEKFRSILHGVLEKFRAPKFKFFNAKLSEVNIKKMLEDSFKEIRLLRDLDVAEVIEDEMVRDILYFVGGILRTLENSVLEGKLELNSPGYASCLRYYQNYVAILLDVVSNSIQEFDSKEVELYKAWAFINVGQSKGNMKQFFEVEELIEKKVCDFENHLKTLSEISYEKHSQMLNLYYLMGLAEIENVKCGLIGGEIIDENLYFENLDSLKKRIIKMQSIEEDLEGIFSQSDVLQRLLDKVLKKDNNVDVEL